MASYDLHAGSCKDANLCSIIPGRRAWRTHVRAAVERRDLSSSVQSLSVIVSVS
jgi:hypothetical protein